MCKNNQKFKIRLLQLDMTTFFLNYSSETVQERITPYPNVILRYFSPISFESLFQCFHIGVFSSLYFALQNGKVHWICVWQIRKSLLGRNKLQNVIFQQLLVPTRFMERCRILLEQSPTEMFTCPRLQSSFQNLFPIISRIDFDTRLDENEQRASISGHCYLNHYLQCSNLEVTWANETHFHFFYRY